MGRLRIHRGVEARLPLNGCLLSPSKSIDPDPWRRLRSNWSSAARERKMGREICRRTCCWEREALKLLGVFERLVCTRVFAFSEVEESGHVAFRAWEGENNRYTLKTLVLSSTRPLSGGGHWIGNNMRGLINKKLYKRFIDVPPV